MQPRPIKANNPLRASDPSLHEKSSRPTERRQGPVDRRQDSALLNDPLTPIIGNPQADVAIVEFFDYTCPFCKAAEPRLEKLVKEDKRVKLVLRSFLFSARVGGRHKGCVASVKQGKYEQFHQAMMMFKGRLQNSTIFRNRRGGRVECRAVCRRHAGA